MTTWQKIALSVVGIFLGGVTAWYQLHVADELTARFWIGLVMAGLSPVASYFIGFAQVNPANQPRTAATLLEATQASPLPVAAKATITEVLGKAVVTEAVKPAAKEKQP